MRRTSLKIDKNGKDFKIVVFRTCGLGDFILSIPAFIMLRKRFPRAQIVLVTMSTTDRAVAAKVAQYAGGRAAAPWVSLVPKGVFDEVITLPGLRPVKFLFSAAKTLWSLKANLIVQMMDVGLPWPQRIKKVLFSALITGRMRQVGWRIPGETIKQGRVPKVDPGLPHHIHGPMQFMNELFGPNSYRDDDVHFSIDLDEEVLCWRNNWISEYAKGRRLIAIAPGAVHSHKDWPIANFLAIAKAVLSDYPDVKIVVSGTGSDADKAHQLVALDPDRVVSTCGIASIPQSAALLARCSLVIGNDGGAMHLADAVGAKVISIVPGLEFPNSIEPWHNVDRAVRHKVTCAPCYSFKFCPAQHNRCMVDLPVSVVLDQIKRAMAEEQMVDRV